VSASRKSLVEQARCSNVAFSLVLESVNVTVGRALVGVVAWKACLGVENLAREGERREQGDEDRAS
jgi:hypothetical protein